MTTTLLLNATFEPLRVISTQRAIVLVLQEKAEVIDESDGEYHSSSLVIKTPSVIKLKRFIQIPYKARIPLSNPAVLRRDNHECAYCDKRKGTTVDHVHPRSKGGPHDWLNVVAACKPCNLKKADKTLEELQRENPGRWELRFKPFVPTGTQWLLIGLRAANPAWESYLPAVA